jgi:hypothetical protein
MPFLNPKPTSSTVDGNSYLTKTLVSRRCARRGGGLWRLTGRLTEPLLGPRQRTRRRSTCRHGHAWTCRKAKAIGQKCKKPWKNQGFRAERTGFEPAVGSEPYAELAIRCFRPLSHLSRSDRILSEIDGDASGKCGGSPTSPTIGRDHRK